MQIEKRVVEAFVVDGQSFATEKEALAYIDSQAAVQEFRAFAETLQEGKSPKAVQAVVNILVKYQHYLDAKKVEPTQSALSIAA